MLPFFRKIRYRSAEDNQFLKYSRYAIGESEGELSCIIRIILGFDRGMSDLNQSRLKVNAGSGDMDRLFLAGRFIVAGR